MNFFTIAVSILIFGFLIVIHEFGHFIAARMSKVKVLEFAIGMGPVLFSKQGKETLFSLRAIPLGGFCRMQGEDESDYSEGSYNSKSKLSRILILSAGAAMNIIGCIILLTAVFFIIGIPTSTIDEVQTGYPAYEAGMVSGDKILSINGEEINSWDDINLALDESRESDYGITLDREGEIIEIQLTSYLDTELDRYRIGITPAREKTILGSLSGGITQSYMYTRLMFSAIGALITGNASTGDLMGPIGVVGIVGETVQYGAVALLNLAAIISLNLAIFNLLPIPALDGSRIVFVLIEWIKGSPVNPEKEGMVHLIGFIILMALALFIAYNDILRLN